jgi:halogenation protein CepH
MTSVPDEEVDVVVIGGGPAGSTVSTAVAMQGHRVLLLEQARMPIYKIGESLLPATVHGVCAMLGVSEELKKAGFIRKRGGTFRWGQSKEPWTFSFAQSDRVTGPTSYAYQVERMKFDLILLDNARRKGVDVREEHTATGPIWNQGRVSGITFTDELGREHKAHAKFVVDASGHQSIFHRIVGQRTYSQFFRNVAVFGYFEGGKRLAPPMSGNIFSAAFDLGWFWYIPLTESLTSVGAVIGEEHAKGLNKKGHEGAYSDFIAACEPIKTLLSSAKRVTDGPYGKIRVRKDYSYSSTSFWIGGLALVGDSACFVDPVFSSGVHLATYSGLQAARSINTLLAGHLGEDRVFTEFERRYRREFGYFYDFLIAFYDLNKELESYYWSARKVLNTVESGNEAFIRLVAGVGGSGERLYSSEEEFLAQRAGMAQALFSPFGACEPNSDPDATPFNHPEFMSGFLTEVSQLQTQARLRGNRAREAPLFEGGLIPSADGFHWCEPPSK